MSWLELPHNKILEFDRYQAEIHKDEPSSRFDYRFLKRTFDWVLSSILLVLLSPLVLLIGLAIRMTSRDGIFFSQKRIGMNSREFDMIKFRTMNKSAGGSSQLAWSENNDDNVSPLGKVLRRFNLDELPQLYNVLRGDMSLVGPRPEQPYWVGIFSREIPGYSLRHQIQTGMTGWAQVNGWRGATSINRRIEHDLYYLHYWSLWFDLKILFRTLWIKS